MILPLVLLFLSTVLGQNLYEGDLCSFSNGDPGVCILPKKCPFVYQELLDGNRPDKLCGFDRSDPIVCCPSSTLTTTTTAAPIEESHIESGDGRGAKARAKCAEYARSVYRLHFPPMLLGIRKPVNVSECGMKSQAFIPNSNRARPKEFPHMAAVGYDTNTTGPGWFCGGSLISEKFVLTAAHCTFSNVLGNATWVRVGDLNLERTDDGATPVDLRVTERIRHPQYKPPSQYHDIALLRLERAVPFNAWIRPACLHTEPSTGTNRAIATGWDHVKWDEDQGSSDLLKVILSFVDQDTCNRTYTSGTVYAKLPDGIYGERMICAGQSSRDTCQGDSGGPLVVYSKTQYCMYDVVGITSLGRSCGSSFPSIHTRVYYYVPWIESVVWPDE